MDPKAQADTLDQDVSVEDQLPTLTSADSPRMRALAAIEEKNRQRIEAEMGVKLDDDTPAPDQVTEQLSEPTPAPEVRKVKVDGRELEVPIDDLVATYQKNTAADRRLKEAAEILEQARQLAAQTQVAEPEPAPAATPVETPEDLKKQAAELLDKLYDGDKDSASEALVNLLAKARGDSPSTPAPVQAVVDPDVLTSQVLERMALNSAFERVKTDYPDIIADPNLEMVAAMQINQRVAAGESRATAMLSVADSLYQSLGKKPTGRQDDTPKPTKSQRQENLERLDTLPSASAAAIQPQSPAESSPSAVIAELASRRLGQSLPR